MESYEELVANVRDFCKERLVAATYTLFFEGIEPVSMDANKMTILVRSEFLKGIILDRYIPILKEAFQHYLGYEVEIFINVFVPAESIEEIPQGSYAYDFDNFIVGPSNKFAHAAAQAVAANPSGAYNPLFIYGGSGLGKTHLLNAIAGEIKKNNPNYDILMVDGEQFTNEIIRAIQQSSTGDFHTKYREADVLLVDDIQFIGGKDSTQEEFFHTFNALYNAGNQIVLVSDRPPKEIKSLEERLKTRFEWGLTADIQPPTFETRVAIIRRKADLLELDVPEDVAEYIANRLKTNIRQLEGAVKKLNAYKTLEHIEPGITSAKNAIKDILNENQPLPVTIDKILVEVAHTFSISPGDIKSRRRSAIISNARKIAMYIIREVTDMSMEDIGREFGGRDHSTVVYSLNETSKRLEQDPRLREIVHDLIKNARQ